MSEDNNNDIEIINNRDLELKKYDEKVLKYNMEKGRLSPYKVLHLWTFKTPT